MSDDARRGESLEAALDRFPAVEERVRRVYGLRLPRHLAVLAALWQSSRQHGGEREALNYLGLAPWGVTDHFASDGLVARDGLDERLHCRFRRDPAEFLTVMSGDSDGLHFGLWYDDPADLPTLTVHNFARDSAETWTLGFATPVDEIQWRLRRVLRDYGSDGEEGDLVRPLLDALDWFSDPLDEALAADGLPRLVDDPRPAGWISIAPSLPAGAGDPRLGESRARLAGFRAGSDEAAGWIADARRDLAAGRPAYALVVGSELHWLDGDAYREAGLDLLVGAYRSLGRDALAGIAEVHAAHRDLRRVDVLTRPHGPRLHPNGV